MNSQIVYLIVTSLLFSTLLYFYLHTKTHISLKFLFIDNLIVIVVASILSYLMSVILSGGPYWLSFIFVPVFVAVIAFTITMIRFWRTPNRKISAKPNEIISPADGNIIYFHKLEVGDVPISYKKGISATLNEVTQTDLLSVPCLIIGINMTPFDVHKNCSPIAGKIILNKYIHGKFLSLKNPEAVAQNERQTVVIQNEELTIGIIQTASRLVRRIDSYVKTGDIVEKGKWYGMIRFGSQVDIIIPHNYVPNVEIGQQVYAAESIIAYK